MIKLKDEVSVCKDRFKTSESEIESLIANHNRELIEVIKDKELKLDHVSSLLQNLLKKSNDKESTLKENRLKEIRIINQITEKIQKTNNFETADRLETGNEDIENLIKMTFNWIDDLKNKISLLEAENSKLKVEIDDLNKSVERYENSKAEGDKKLELTQEKLNNLDEQNKNSEKNFLEEKHQLNETIKLLKAEIDNLSDNYKIELAKKLSEEREKSKQESQNMEKLNEQTFLLVIFI